jgi:hypothetical protein
LSGNAEIGVLQLNRDNNANTFVTLGGTFTGVVSTLNLNGTAEQWTMGSPIPTIIKGVTDVSVFSKFTLGKFLSGNQSISPNYKLQLRPSANDEAILVWQ